MTASEIQSEQSTYSKTSASTTAAQTSLQKSATEQTTLPVIEEQLKVGKRAVLKGGVRVYQHITERPVEESVSLSEEHVTVTRTPVNQPATEAEIQLCVEALEGCPTESIGQIIQ